MKLRIKRALVLIAFSLFIASITGCTFEEEEKILDIITNGKYSEFTDNLIEDISSAAESTLALPASSDASSATASGNESSNNKQGTSSSSSLSNDFASEGAATETTAPGTSAEKGERDTVKSLVKGLKKNNSTCSVDGNSTALKTEEDVTKRVFSAAGDYVNFSVLMSDATCLHTAEWYKEQFPEIDSLEINLENSAIYSNGICINFTNVSCIMDPHVSYALRTGDTSYLDTNVEKSVYSLINQATDALALPDTLSDIEIIKEIHDYLINLAKYDTEVPGMRSEESNASNSHNPIGLLHEAKAVCDGYARTFKLLLQKHGIVSRVVSGYANNGSTIERHAWNYVLLNGKWYQTDVTWDDPVPDGQLIYTYFMRPDEDFTNHESGDSWTDSVSCTDASYRAYPYEEYKCNSDAELEKIYNEQLYDSFFYFLYLTDGSLSEKYIIDYLISNEKVAIHYYPSETVGEYSLLKVRNPRAYPE
ncbi:MAG: hypothetical protein K6B75_00040 [Lachnospiraceae bacterium]|nr:hypothetical protein [Lachnospiraceae bacterium]